MRYKAIILFFMFLLTFVGIHLLNSKLRGLEAYNGNIFYNDISRLVLTEYIDILTFFAITLILAIVFIFILYKILSINKNIFNNIKKIFNNVYYQIRDNLDTKNISILLFFIAVLFKLLLFDFDLNFGNKKVPAMLNNWYYGNQFNVYKAYTFIAVSFSLLFDDFNYYLSMLNIIFGSATISIWYLIVSKTNIYPSIKLIFCLMILFYLPLTAAETLLRTDILYIFFLSLSILFLINLSGKYNYKNLIYLNLILLVSCFIREQTIYLLPLYLFFMIMQLEKKYYISAVLTLSVTVITTSSFISTYNTNKYGFDSLFRDMVLIEKIMQYGYLDDKTRSSYETNLSPDAQLLLNDIVYIYETNLLPSRREAHIDQIDMPQWWSLVRPHHQTIFQKTHQSGTIGSEDIAVIQKLIITDLSKPNNFSRNYNADEISGLIDTTYSKLHSQDEIRLLRDIQYIITNDFYYENAGYMSVFELFSLKTDNEHCKNRGEPFGYKRVWNIRPPKEIIDLYSQQRFSAQCLIDVTSRINRSYLVGIRSNDAYHVASQKISPSFNHESQDYEYHPLVLSNIKEIVASMPILYFVQSIIVGTSQTGYVPVPSGMSLRFSNVYSNSIYSDFMLIDLQKIYYIFINFWYVFCFFAFLLSFFISNKKIRNINLFFSIFPLYYGFFMAFASPAEFARLMLPIIPFILYCGLSVLILFYMLIFTKYLNKTLIDTRKE